MGRLGCNNIVAGTLAATILLLPTSSYNCFGVMFKIGGQTGSSEYEFDPPDDREQDSDDPEEKEVEFPKGTRAHDVAKKAIQRKSSKSKPVDSD